MDGRKTKYLVNINSSVVDGIPKKLQPIRRWVETSCNLGPRMTTGESITGRDNELFGTIGADGIDGGLIVLQNERGDHAAVSC